MPIMRWLALLATVVLAGCTGSPPPADALFDGGDADRWVRVDGAETGWDVDGEEMIVVPGSGTIRTRDTYQDFALHLEFLVPESPDGATGQGRGNSGVYIQHRYEVQILDSWGEPPSQRGCAALYGQRAPDVNASRPPGEWQTYDIDFTAARFDDAGAKTADARITVRHNGVLVHDDVALPTKTGAGRPEGPEPGPIVLQDHGNPVRFRRIFLSAP
jgi:hypothetical protein